MPLFDETQALQQPRRCFVAWIDLRFQAPQAHSAEREVDQRRRRFLHVAGAPMLASQQIAQFGSPVRQVEVKQQARADDAPRRALHDHELPCLAGGEARHRAAQPLLRVRHASPAFIREIARDCVVRVHLEQ